MSGQYLQKSVSFHGISAGGRQGAYTAPRRSLRCSRWLVLLAGLSTLAAFSGCKKPSGKIDKLYKVHGKVLFDKQPAVGATVVLSPQEGSFPPGINPMAMTDKDGKFQINSYNPDDGAPAGGYAITVTWFKVIEAPSGVTPGPNVIPTKYATAETSPLKFTVQAKDVNEVPVIDIASNER